MEIEKISSEWLKEEYYKIKHKSGLEICVYPKNFAQSSAMIGTRFGSVNSSFTVDGGEPHSVPDGTAHFLEHKLFENADGKDSFEKYALYGADANAFTSSSSTCYLFSGIDHLYECLEILLRTVFEPYFTAENVKKEQGIIAQEILMGEDENESRLYDMVLKAMYKNCPVNKKIAGTVESVMSITPEILYDCHRAFYNPSNMILCVCGKFDVDKTLEVVDRVIGNIESHKIVTLFPDEPDEIVVDSVSEYSDITNEMFMIGEKLPVLKSPVERMKRVLLTDMVVHFFSGNTSEFYNDMYMKNLINKSFSSSSDDSSNYAYTYFCGETINTEELFENMKSYADKLKKNPPSKEKFERLKKVFYADNIRGYDYTSWITESYVYRYGLDDCDLFGESEILRSLEYEDFLNRLNEFFNEKNIVKAVLYPKKENTNE